MGRSEESQAPSKGSSWSLLQQGTCQNLWSPRSWGFDQNMEMGTAILQFVLILYDIVYWCILKVELWHSSRHCKLPWVKFMAATSREVWARPNCAAFASRPWHRVKHQERWWQALVGNGESMIDRNSMHVRIFRSRASKNDRFCFLFIVLLLYTIPKTFAEYPQNRKQKTNASRSQEWPVEHPVESY